MTNYFNHAYCSNSKLSSLGREIGVLPEILGDTYERFRLGTLADAVITEPENLNFKDMTVGQYSFTKEEYNVALAKKKRLEQNKIYASYLKLNPEFQKEVYLEQFDFGKFKLNMKAKLDYFATSIVADLKTTASTSQKQFEECVYRFSYHRQMVLYCLLTGCKEAILFAVSNAKPYNVFVVRIKEGSKVWKDGLKELNELAFKYYMSL